MGRDSRKRRRGGTSRQTVNPRSALQVEVEGCVETVFNCLFHAFEKPQHSEAQRTLWESQNLAVKVKMLLDAIGAEAVGKLLQRKTDEFLEKLLKTIKKEEDKRTSLTLMEDAFDFLEQSVDLVMSLLGCPLCLRPSKQHFYSSLLLDVRLKSLLTLPSDSPQAMNLDQLLAFIDPEATQLSDEDVAAEEEIAAFRQTLSKPALFARRVRPRISEEWLRRMEQKEARGGY